jgi:uncharacterized protein YyaL (SSP411 family)
MPNRLAGEVSPYLQQHVDNPVDWYPFGSEAFESARRRGVPVFLSIGYSSCHWCHVMARESFEDQATADLLNRDFVSIKVDREERPDVDGVYMRAVQRMTNRGGWPMSVFLTPEGMPFYGGSYWPKEPAPGLPSFRQVLAAVAGAWKERRSEVNALVQSVSAAVAESSAAGTEVPSAIDPAVVDQACEQLLTRMWDREYGGFGAAPKFPRAMVVQWLLQRYARTGQRDALEAAVHSLEAMMKGGIHDQLSGGFARYSTDRRWLVPHFEKMLCDNALLLPSYAMAATLTGRADLRRVAESTATYLLNDMRNEEGAFLSATAADSSGGEGLFYTWKYEELVQALVDAGVPPLPWADFLGAVPEGNWNGTNVLSEAVSREQVAQVLDLSLDGFDAEWDRLRDHLAARRRLRDHPPTDDKVLTDWNSLTGLGLARAGRLLTEPAWIDAAVVAVEFLHRHLVRDDQLEHVWRNGQASTGGFLLDHAALALADLELFLATGDDEYFTRALALGLRAQRVFGIEGGEGGWYQTAGAGDGLYLRPKDHADDATPSGTSVMVEVCSTLSALTGDHVWQERAVGGLWSLQERARREPLNYGWLLGQLEAHAAGSTEVVIVGAAGPARDRLASAALRRPRPGCTVVVAGHDHADTVPLLAGRREIAASPTAYVCRDMACRQPVNSAADLEALLGV